MDATILRALAEDWPAPLVYRVVPVTSPAAGANFSFVTPGESTFALVALTATLVTSAAVANRAATLNVSDGTTTLWSVEAGAVQTATSTVRYSWVTEYPAFPTTIVGGALVVPMAPTYLPPGFTIASSVALLDAGDQWSAITATVVEVLTGHVERERTLADTITDRAEALAGVLEGSL
ncbi:MAG TPA: hypothetical protein VFO15_17985 [Xanthobacteraceae bacterium]|nr:hypothetical protein [Xanthobacteraceae bacterium]